jgi:hypothetical protein
MLIDTLIATPQIFSLADIDTPHYAIIDIAIIIAITSLRQLSLPLRCHSHLR